MDQTTGQNPGNATAGNPIDSDPIDGTGATDTTGIMTDTDTGNAYGYVPPVTPLDPPARERPRFRLRRSGTDRMLGGVCGGLAESLDVDPAVLRIGLVVLTVIGVGATIPIYLAVWLLAPETDTP